MVFWGKSISIRTQISSLKGPYLRPGPPRYRLLSQRIVGFGNYEPPEDTKLPDGSVNVAKAAPRVAQDVMLCRFHNTHFGMLWEEHARNPLGSIITSI